MDMYGKRELSKREKEVVVLVCRGLKNSEIAETLGITGSTVKKYVGDIYNKVGVYNRVELTLWYVSRKTN